LKTVTGLLAGILFFVVPILLVVAIIKGIPWISKEIYPWLAPVVSFCMILDLVLLPFAIIRRARGPISVVFVTSSFVYGLMLWIYSAMVAFFIWGYRGLFLGLFLMGVGVVPIAAVASVLNGEWSVVAEIILGIVLTYGARMGGLLLASSIEREPAPL
jgi:hypothetical protein